MQRYMYSVSLCLMLCAIFLVGCSKEETPTGNGNVSITVTPASASLWAGESVQLNAAVSGGSSTGTHWSISPPVGTISDAGLYTAPLQPDSDSVIVTVTATADADPGVTAKATIIVRKIPALRRPGVGSIFLARTYQTDSTGEKTPDGDVTSSIRVIDDGVTHHGKDSLISIYTGSDTSYYRIESNADVWIELHSYGLAPVAWVRLPFGGRNIAMVLVDSLITPGVHLTETFTGEYLGTAIDTVGGSPLVVRRVRYTLVEDLTGTNGYHYAQSGNARFAPAIGFFTHNDWSEVVQNGGSPFRDGQVWDLTSYVLQ